MTDANTNYIDLLKTTDTNNNLTAAERETGIRFARDEDRATVETEEKHIAKRLLAHPEFELDYYWTSGDEASWGKRVEADNYHEDGHDARKPVYGVSGTIPVTAIGIKPRSPDYGGHSKVVTRKWLAKVEEAQADD